MTLRTALVIDGQAEGAKRAAQDTAVAIRQVERAAEDASSQTKAVSDTLKQASSSAGAAAGGLKEVAPAAREAGGELDLLGNRSDQLTSKFSTARTALLGFVGGIAGGMALAAVSGVVEGAVAALGTYAANALTRTDEINAALKGHVALIRSIKGAYSEAEGGASSYGRNSVAILRFGAQQDESRLQQAYRDALPDGGMFNAGIFASGASGFSDQQLGPFAGAVREFRAEMREGKADVIAFRNEVAGIAADLPGDSAFRDMAQTILEDTEKASEALESLRRSQDALRGLQGDTDAAARALGGAADKYDSLGRSASAAAGAVPRTTASIRDSGSAAAIAAGQIERYRAASQGSGSDNVTPSAARTAATPQAFAAGGIVDRPVLFSYGGGRAGLMGEAGPEAILPLSGGRVRARTAAGSEITLDLVRMGDGALGVSMPDAFGLGGSFGMSGYGTIDRRGSGERLDRLAGDVNLARGALSGFVSGLRQGQGALASLGSVIASISDRALDRAVGAVDDALFGKSGPFGALGSLFGGASQWDLASSGAIHGLFHGGGRAGRSASSSRLVSPLAFIGAPRMHRGGIAGGEVPIIAREGEEIGWPQDLARKYGGQGQVNNFYIETPDARSFSESRASVARSAARLSARSARYV